MALEQQHGDYLISDDPRRLEVDAVHAYLHRSYWAEGIPRETVARSVENSLCVGAYMATGSQVGLARIISDYATYAYLCDVYVLESHRQQGLAKALMRFVTEHPRLQGLRRFSLITQDAHPLYAQFGFTPIATPERHMARLTPDVYKRSRP